MDRHPHVEVLIPTSGPRRKAADRRRVHDLLKPRSHDLAAPHRGSTVPRPCGPRVCRSNPTHFTEAFPQEEVGRSLHSTLAHLVPLRLRSGHVPYLFLTELGHPLTGIRGHLPRYLTVAPVDMSGIWEPANRPSKRCLYRNGPPWLPCGFRHSTSVV